MNYPQSDQDWMNADWLEFKVLSSEFDVYSLDDFQSVLEELQDVESEDFCESDNDFQNKIEQIIREINLREQHLGSTYPFRFSDDGKSLILKHTLNEGCYVYLFCLIISHHNRREILLVDPPMNNTVRDLFQICATLAGAGKVNGSAISFGFPRPSTTPFLDALKEAYAKIGEGEVISKFRLGQSKYVKDSEIDIIAWQYQPVNLPGKYYVLGQAASGANWKDKPVKGAMECFHKEWFTSSPVSTANSAHFIPFCLDINEGAELTHMVRTLTNKFGDLIFRYRLPLYAQRGIDLFNQKNADIYVDRADDYPKIKDYVDNFRKTL